MKAVIVSAFGASDALQVVDQDEPRPGPGQAVIQVEAAGVGYVDVMARTGNYLPFSEPGFVPGVEAAGTVTAVGRGVDERWMGQRVFTVTGGGAYAESVIADGNGLVRLPEGVSAAEAVALGVNALVASLSLKRAGLTKSERVLVRGAGGGIGSMAAQLAALAGAEVVAITSSSERGERLRALGIAEFQDRTSGGSGDASSYDVIVDPVAGPELGRCIGLLRPNGRYVLAGAAGGAPAPDTFESLINNYHNSPTVLAFSLSSIDVDARGAEAAELFNRAARGDLVAVVGEQIPLTEAHRAHELLESASVFGKIILNP